MALMLAETYKAFLAAGAGEEQAANAAAELAGYDSRLAQIESTIVAFRGEMKTDMAALRGEMKTDMATLRGAMSVVHWMLTLLIGLVITIALKMFL